ncbi:MAG: hemerythrin domain-containing protein [Bacteroidales bacterium]|jgi:regulator of cell morphogenesis and NO signaling|nr:hemerythrin domain-containing protein [Bacteroidales bacterium]
MHKLGKYTGTDMMIDLICENYRTLLVMSRFGIGVGFGDKTIGDVCRTTGVDVKTFLSVVNLLLDDEPISDFSASGLSVESLVAYLQSSHVYFLNYRLPGIRNQLDKILSQRQDDLSQAILRYFDEYVAEVRKHMMYEENTVFPYVRSLIGGKKQSRYSIAVFRKQHNQVEARLTEFKQIIIRYYPSKSTNEINSVLFDIFDCEHDLAFHNSVEDRLFVPAIMEIEHRTADKS